MNSLSLVRKGGQARTLFLPVLSVLVIFIPLAILRPIVLKYNGLDLLLNMSIPLSLATMAQMFAMAVDEIDFSLGNLVSLVTCIVGAIIPSHPLWGILALVGIVVAYVFIGALLYIRKLSSIVVTIGLSFVWTGLAVTMQPTPGANIPAVLANIMSVTTPLIPMPLLFLVVLAVLGHLLLFRTNFGILVRGVGGNAKAVALSGHSVALVKGMSFGLVAVLAILAGIALAGITTSSDANVASNYTLLAVAGVMLGGGSFWGGKVSAVGAVLGACVMTLVGTLLTFLQVSPDWAIGAQGGILIVVLFLNGVVGTRGTSKYV